MKHNILVFPCGSEIGLEIYRSLNWSTHFNVIGGSSVDDHGKFVFKQYIGDLPFVDESNFISRLNEVVKSNNIEFIFPAHDSVLLKLAQAVAENKLSCQLVAPHVTTCEITRSKLKTYKLFHDLIPTPKIYMNVQAIHPQDLPIFLKPEIGQGSKGTHIARTLEDIEYYTQNDPTLLLLEYLPGKEYTVDCFTNKDGQLLFCEGRERRRIQNGISVCSEHIKDSRFQKLAKKINKKLKLRGVWFFQVKENAESQLVLLEIAPSVAGTMGLTRCRGVNLALLTLFDAMGQDVNIFENSYNLVIDRALESTYTHDIQYDNVYLDLDDLLIFDGRVNPQVMAFVFQCVNKGITLHLLTKHKKNLEQTLKVHKLLGIFDEVICVKSKEEKYLSITERNSIFIDDSFAERKKVYEACDIPVFDTHMIESLIEKF